MLTDFLSLLCLGLCLGYEDDKKNEKFPKPSLIAWPSPVVEVKSNVTLKCQSPARNATFSLDKMHDSGSRQQSSAGDDAHFPITDLEPEDAGQYFCTYNNTTTSHEWSEKSEYLQLVVTGSLLKLPLPVNTDPETTPDQSVTLRCLIPYNGTEHVTMALLKYGIPKPLQVKEMRKNQADFMLSTLTSNDSGNYSCVYYQRRLPHLGSFPSNSLEILVTDEKEGHGAPTIKKADLLPRPSLSDSPGSVAAPWSQVTLQCSSSHQGATFVLGKVETLEVLEQQRPAGNHADFLFQDLNHKDAHSYICLNYLREESLIWSEYSAYLQLVVTGGDEGSSTLPSKQDSRVTYVVVFSCVIIILLFLSIFLIYKCFYHDAAPSKQERTSLSAADPPEVSYAELNTNAMLEAASVPPKEPPGSCDYAVLNV
ncbi:V-set and transmembrane domain-containing protein 1-like isoform X2 [Choloepus didactylus]|uniref:V-set and transmembrane domain-containing protein 1-like isoform X2 n=1 Tax=Choloepus didactylus TaxID=27675 RepID=UPI00189C859B|nr:V-set and transmembrane domain-containing protein 1-like isoform X2 [Choloepus didactylus]